MTFTDDDFEKINIFQQNTKKQAQRRAAAGVTG